MWSQCCLDTCATHSAPAAVSVIHQGNSREVTLHDDLAAFMRLLLGQETLICPLLQRLVGMQNHPGMSGLCLGPLHVSQNKLGNSPLSSVLLLEIPYVRDQEWGSQDTCPKGGREA